jgi:ABC-type xylose transport system permease subunit
VKRPPFIGDAAAKADEGRVYGLILVILVMGVLAGGVGLPDLDQRIDHRRTITVHHRP